MLLESVSFQLVGLLKVRGVPWMVTATPLGGGTGLMFGDCGSRAWETLCAVVVALAVGVVDVVCPPSCYVLTGRYLASDTMDNFG